MKFFCQNFLWNFFIYFFSLGQFPLNRILKKIFASEYFGFINFNLIFFVNFSNQFMITITKPSIRLKYLACKHYTIKCLLKKIAFNVNISHYIIIVKALLNVIKSNVYHCVLGYDKQFLYAAITRCVMSFKSSLSERGYQFHHKCSNLLTA